MSSMTLGSMIEADQRLRAHEVLVRRNKKIARDAEVWRRYEENYIDMASKAPGRIEAETERSVEGEGK